MKLRTFTVNMKYKSIIPIIVLILGIITEFYSQPIRKNLSVNQYYLVESLMVLLPVFVVVYIRRREIHYHRNFFMNFMIIGYSLASIGILVLALLKSYNFINQDAIANTARYLMISNSLLLVYLLGYEIYYSKKHWV